MACFRVFVYGTLKRNRPNHNIMQDSTNGKAQFVTTGTTMEPYPLIVASSANIPFLLDSSGKGQNIHGEVYDIDKKMLEFLDAFESIGVLYDRELIKVKINKEETSNIVTNDNEFQDCYTYVLKNFREELLSREMIADYNNVYAASYKKHVDRDPEVDNVAQQVKNIT